ncbi:4026_t:CDS:10 [Acaulospora morrowiae]|uniref:4026_t:CDS:1 n=1 Tax=Acaulospora morrowiae TaxID=94023 RepID=A0A9N9FHZ2_9GLOM|nr:4026_t:CDS:10 [Acaulospora morrowiae]
MVSITDSTTPSTTYSESTYSETTYSEFIYSETTYSEFIYSETTYSEFIYSETIYSESTYSESTYSETTYSESTYPVTTYSESTHSDPTASITDTKFYTHDSYASTSPGTRINRPTSSPNLIQSTSPLQFVHHPSSYNISAVQTSFKALIKRGELSYSESNGYHVRSAASYPDGSSVILRLSLNETSTDAGLFCSVPQLYLRVVSSDGNITKVEPNVSIDRINFCRNVTRVQNVTMIPQDLIRIYPLAPNYILIAYVRISTGGESYTHQEIGTVINEKGDIQYDRINLGPINMTSGDTSVLGRAVSNVNPSKGLIWVNFQIRSFVRWMNVYHANTTKPFTLELPTTVNISVISTADGGYCLVTVDQSPSSVSPWKVKARFLRPDSFQPTPEILLYDNTVPIYIEMCTNTNNETGIECILGFAHDTTTFYVRIPFLSSGAVKDYFPMDSFSNSTYSVDRIMPLIGGEYLFTGFSGSRNGTDLTFSGNIYNLTGKYLYSSNFSKFPANTSLLYGVFPNNTLWMIYESNSAGDGWNYSTFFIPKSALLDIYESIVIIPNDTVVLGTQRITVNFPISVVLSTGKFSIYEINQKDSTNKILKQSYIARDTAYVTQSDNQTLLLKVLGSTFFTPYARYLVEIENDFVRDASDNEPLLGTSRYLLTGGKVSEPLEENVRGIVYLTREASNRYWGNALTIDLFRPMTSEFCTILSLSPYRLQIIDKWQWDSNMQVIFKLEISKGTNDTQDRSVTAVAEALNLLISFKNVSSVMLYPNASLLDSDRGFTVTQTVWERYQLRLFGFGSILLLCAVLALLSYRDRNYGNGLFVFKLLLIWVDFVLDVLFVWFHAHDIYLLFYPTLVFMISSIAFNAMTSFFVIIREITYENYFAKWFRTYHNIAAIFSLSAAIDIESLTIIHSRLAGLRAFDAPLSKGAKRWIFWCGIINFMIEDTPQLIVQIVYVILCVNYQLIPFLNLMSASLLCSVMLLGNIYRFYEQITADNDNASNRGSEKNALGTESTRTEGSMNQENEGSEEHLIAPPEDVFSPWHYPRIPVTHTERSSIPLPPLAAKEKRNFVDENEYQRGESSSRTKIQSSDKVGVYYPKNIDNDGEQSQLLNMNNSGNENRRQSITITNSIRRETVFGNDTSRAVFGGYENMQKGAGMLVGK